MWKQTRRIKLNRHRVKIPTVLHQTLSKNHSEVFNRLILFLASLLVRFELNFLFLNINEMGFKLRFYSKIDWIF